MITAGIIIIVVGLVWIGFAIKNAPEMDENENLIDKDKDPKVKQYNVFGKNINGKE